MKKKSFLTIFLIAIIFSGLFLVITSSYDTVRASTSVSGIITLDTTWTQASSPYTLTGNVLVNNGVTLTVEAGVTVNLNGYYIEVNGTFVARGTDTNQIFFKDGYESNEGITFDPMSVSWNQSAGTGSIIENAALDSVGIFCYDAAPKINRNLFYNSGTYIQAQYAILFIGPYSKPSMVISNNTFGSNYAQAAIEINAAGSSSPIIINNNFVDANRYNLQSGFDTPFTNATYNWWGTTDIQAINQTIYDYKNNFQVGTVSFVPFLTSPNSQAPTYITASASYGGSISPSGYVPVSYGGSQTFNITANNGYHILDVKVNGTSVGAVSPYTLQNIQGTTTISASFALNPTTTPTPTPSPTPLPTGPTQISGVINSNSTWYKTGSPYNLVGNVLVNNSVTLKIEAGATVNLNGYYIDVNGTLAASGTGTNQINMNGGNKWYGGIQFESSSEAWNESTSTGCIIENTVLDSVEIFVEAGSPKINKDLFYNSGEYPNPNTAIYVEEGYNIGSQTNSVTVISNNTIGSGYGLTGLYIHDMNYPSPLIRNNNFYSGDPYNIYLQYSSDVNASYNWWATTDPELINQTIYDFKDNFQTGVVNFVPFLTAPNPSAPYYNPNPTPTPTPSKSPTPTPTTAPTPTPTATPTPSPAPTPTSLPTPNPTPHSSPSPSPSPMPQPNNTTTLEVSCRSSTSYSNFKVDITGNLRSSNGLAIPNAHVLLSYSVNDGDSWIDLTTATTDGNGDFSVSWNAQVSGTYLVKAVYEGNSDYSNSTSIVNFIVTPFEQQKVFSVTSNSTITALYFNSTGNQLSFSTNGTSGTTGYVDIYIPKSLVSDASSLRVYLDGAPLTYTASAQDDAWLVSFTYHQSSHEVSINLGSSLGLVAVTGISQFVLVGTVAIILAISAAVLLVWQRKRIKCKASQMQK